MTKTLKLLVSVEVEVPDNFSDDNVVLGDVEFKLDSTLKDSVKVLSVTPEFPDQLDDSDDWGLGDE